MIEALKRVDKDAPSEVQNVWLKELPDLVHQVSFQIIQSTRDLKEMKESYEATKARLMFEIAKETESGKQKYGNQSVRDAVLAMRIEEDSECVAQRKAIWDLDDDIKRLEAHREYYAQQFRVLKDVIYYGFRSKELEEIKKIQINKSKILVDMNERE